jgi:LysR family transcriptional regulator, chromosome initiation inhibitor
MFDYRQLEALSVLAREGTFLKASKRLGLSQPAVSERIRLLEQAVGSPLIIRSVPVQPTHQGQRLINHFYEVSLMESSVVDTLGMNHDATESLPIIPVAVNFDSLATWFIPAVSPLLEQRKCIFQFQSLDQRLTIEELKAGRVVACVSSVKTAPGGCVSEFLGHLNYICVSSPDFLKRYFAKGPALRDLIAAPSVVYGKDDYMHDEFLRRHFKKEHAAPSYMFVPHLNAMRETILSGYAYGLLPEISVTQDLRVGTLKEVTPGKRLVTELYWHSTDIRTPILTSLRTAIKEYADKNLS